MVISLWEKSHTVFMKYLLSMWLLNGPAFFVSCDIFIIVNPLSAKFFRGHINIYLHFMSYLHANTTQVVEISPRARQGPAYSTKSISWLLMSWRRKEPGHQQP